MKDVRSQPMPKCMMPDGAEPCECYVDLWKLALEKQERVKALEEALKTAEENFRMLDKESTYWNVSVPLRVCQDVLGVK